MTEETRQTLILWAETYNDPQYFQEDPIAFPTLFAQRFKAGKRSLADVEIAAVFAAHFAWGRRAMIIRDCGRLFEEMDWKPYEYVMRGKWRDDGTSIHRTIKWSEVAGREKSPLQGSPGNMSAKQSVISLTVTRSFCFLDVSPSATASS